MNFLARLFRNYARHSLAASLVTIILAASLVAIIPPTACASPVAALAVLAALWLVIGKAE